MSTSGICSLSLVALCLKHLRLPCKAVSRCHAGRASRVLINVKPQASTPNQGRHRESRGRGQRMLCGCFPLTHLMTKKGNGRQTSKQKHANMSLVMTHCGVEKERRTVDEVNVTVKE